MNKAELDLEIRFRAIEHMLGYIGRIAVLAAGITPEQMRQARVSAREKLSKETFPGLDAAMGDHVGAEFADYVLKILDQIESQVTDAYREAHRRESE